MRSTLVLKRSRQSRRRPLQIVSPWICPRDGVRAVRAVRETNGTYITVPDAEIIKAIAELGKMGIFAEPAGRQRMPVWCAAATSQGLVRGDEPVLALNTGSGLKHVCAAMQAVVAAPIIEPTLSAVKKIL